MKIAYIAGLNIKMDGVNKKVFNQIKSWEKLGHTVKPFFTTLKKSPYFSSYILWKRFNLLNPCIKLLVDLYKYNPDCIYYRFQSITFFSFIFFLLFKNKIILEVNTLAHKERKLFSTKSFFNRQNYYINLILEPIFVKLAKGLIGVTSEITNSTEYNIQKNRCTIPNNIDVNNINLVKNTHDREKINLFFIGSPDQTWHGVDKIISLAKIIPEYDFHIVGPSKDEFKHTQLPSNIYFYGFLPENEFVKIMEKCHVCLSALALYRKKMDEACALKVLDYLAMGFPIIYAYHETVFLNEKPNFVLELPNTEHVFDDTTNINAIKDFCEKNKYRIVSHEEIKPYIDSKVWETKRINAVLSWI